MVQVKKDGVRKAILRAAFRHFSKIGYARTTVSRIAQGAGVSPATVYVYFKSKLQIFFEIYGPWLNGQLDELGDELARLKQPDAKLRRIFTCLWMDIPSANGGFSNNLIQALSTASLEQGYSNATQLAFRRRITGFLQESLGDDNPAIDIEQVVLTIFMAFDGFSLNYVLNPDARCSSATVDAACRWLLDGAAAPTVAAARPLTRLRARR